MMEPPGASHQRLLSLFVTLYVIESVYCFYLDYALWLLALRLLAGFSLRGAGPAVPPADRCMSLTSTLIIGMLLLLPAAFAHSDMYAQPTAYAPAPESAVLDGREPPLTPERVDANSNLLSRASRANVLLFAATLDRTSGAWLFVVDAGIACIGMLLLSSQFAQFDPVLWSLRGRRRPTDTAS
jgi:hypothetical protein